jgi:tetratricopeptide (TPR) repeat protein
MRALLFLYAVAAPAQVMMLTVLGFNAAGQPICSEQGRLSNEPGVVETPRACFLRAAKVIARTPAGNELAFSAVRGDDVSRGRVLLGFHLPTTGQEMLFSAQPVQVQTRKPETLAEWKQSSDPVAERHLRAGAPLLDRGDAVAAIPHLRKAVDKKPDFAEAWYLLGLAYEQTEATADKIKAWERVCALDPFHVIAARRLVVAYLKEKRQLEAQALVFDVQKTSPYVAMQLQNTINVYKLELTISGAGLPGQPLKQQQ